MQRLDDGELVLGADAREHAAAPDRLGIFPRSVEFFPRHDFLARRCDGELFCDGERRCGAVARDHHRAHARPPARFDRLFCALARRIEERGKPQKVELCLVCAFGKGENAHRALFVSGGFLADAGAKFLRQSPSVRRAAVRKDDVERALFKKERSPFRLDAHAHEARFGSEGAAPREQPPFAPLSAGFRVFGERHFGGIAHKGARAPLDAPAQAHTAQEPFFTPVGKGGAHRHAVPGEGARLVRTDAGAAAQRFDGGEAAAGDAEGAHALHAHREDDGDDGAHALGDGGDRDGDRGHQVLQNARPLRQNAHHKERRRDGEHGVRDDLRKAGEHFIKGRKDGLRSFEKVGDGAHLRVHARLRHDAARPARKAERARKEGVFPLGKGGLFHGAVALSDGARFPRERRFVAFHPFRREDAAVGGDAVALLDLNDVSRHEKGGGKQTHPPPAHNFCRRRGELFQLFDGAVGAVLLHHPHRRVEHDDEEQDGGVGEFGPVPRDIGEHARKDCRRHEDERHEVFELGKEEGGDAPPLALFELVFSECSKAALRLLLREPPFRAVESFQSVLFGTGVEFHTLKV